MCTLCGWLLLFALHSKPKVMNAQKTASAAASAAGAAAAPGGAAFPAATTASGSGSGSGSGAGAVEAVRRAKAAASPVVITRASAAAAAPKPKAWSKPVAPTAPATATAATNLSADEEPAQIEGSPNASDNDAAGSDSEGSEADNEKANAVDVRLALVCVGLSLRGQVCESPSNRVVWCVVGLVCLTERVSIWLGLHQTALLARARRLQPTPNQRWNKGRPSRLRLQSS
jgi:hypothetical protein